jgi:hypothetical protein
MGRLGMATMTHATLPPAQWSKQVEPYLHHLSPQENHPEIRGQTQADPLAAQLVKLKEGPWGWPLAALWVIFHRL